MPKKSGLDRREDRDVKTRADRDRGSADLVERFGAQHGATFPPGAGTRRLTAYDAMDRTTSETLFDFDSAYVSGDLTDTEREERTELTYDAAGRGHRTYYDYDPLHRMARRRVDARVRPEHAAALARVPERVDCRAA